MEIETTSTALTPPNDPRPRLAEPPPVRVEAIEDVRLPATSSLEKELDAFYVKRLRFERMESSGAAAIGYRSATVPVLFHLVERLPERADFRPLRVEIPHWQEFIKELNEAEMVYEWQKGMVPGTDVILLRDPAGNWVSVGAWKTVR